jgi:hypothetical protein
MTDEDRPYTCGGFLFICGKPWFSDGNDYLDFAGMNWCYTELKRDLRNQALPPGMIINVRGYLPVVVVADRKNPAKRGEPVTYSLCPITDIYSTLAEYVGNNCMIKLTTEDLKHV